MLFHTDNGAWHAFAVMGTYSDSAPWNCEKSKRILDGAIKVLEKETMAPNWTGSIQGLALLATGKPEYLPKLRDFARGLAKENPDPDKKPAGPTWGDAWNMGYRLLFLCEYYMVTRDREILPSIDKSALLLARGQSMYGNNGKNSITAVMFAAIGNKPKETEFFARMATAG